jgi:hypothetical protein
MLVGLRSRGLYRLLFNFYIKKKVGMLGGRRSRGLYRLTVRKMDLILRSIERMLKMQFSMARKFTLQPLRRYDVKPPGKTEQA